MEYTEGESLEIKTLGDAWKVFERHGLEGKYCPLCDQFAQARILQKQDEIISDMYEAIRCILEDYRDKRAKTFLPVSTHTMLLNAKAKAKRRE